MPSCHATPRHAILLARLVLTGNEYVLARRDGVLLDGRPDGAKRTEPTLTLTLPLTLTLTLTLALSLAQPEPSPSPNPNPNRSPNRNPPGASAQIYAVAQSRDRAAGAAESRGTAFAIGNKVK